MIFYEKLSEGLGSYFIDTLFSDIDSLQLYGGIHKKYFGFHRMLSTEPEIVKKKLNF